MDPSAYNMKSPAVKRLMREAQELREPTEDYYAQPLEDNLFEWHFTIRGPSDTEFDGGVYHGRIILPPDYPMKPPSIVVLTPNGRFEVNKKICLSISGHHPESWQPSWSIRTALMAMIGFMPTHGNGAIGSLDFTADERKILAKKSAEWECPACGPIKALLVVPTEMSGSNNAEAQDLAAQISFKTESEVKEAIKKGNYAVVTPPAPATPHPTASPSAGAVAGHSATPPSAPSVPPAAESPPPVPTASGQLKKLIENISVSAPSSSAPSTSSQLSNTGANLDQKSCHSEFSDIPDGSSVASHTNPNPEDPLEMFPKRRGTVARDTVEKLVRPSLGVSLEERGTLGSRNTQQGGGNYLPDYVYLGVICILSLTLGALVFRRFFIM